MAVRDEAPVEVRSDGELPAAGQLKQLYVEWRAAVARRSASGELRAHTAEREALQRFVEALAQFADRDAWEAERQRIDANEARCLCGHPLEHHDESGSCFHVVGCSTVCQCGSVDTTA